MSGNGNYGNGGGGGGGGSHGYGYASSKPRVQGPSGGIRGVAVPGGHLPVDFLQGLRRVGADDDLSGLGERE